MSEDLRLPERRRRERGMAFILVLSVLMALLVLAVPFLAVARSDSAASTAYWARAQARAQSEALLRYARIRLEEGHRSRELARGADAPPEGTDEARRFVHVTPDEDTPEEASPPVDLIGSDGKPLTDPDGAVLMAHRDQRGLTVDLRVRDLSAQPRLQSSPDFLVASVLGRSVLASDITDDDVEVNLEDGSGFPERDGYLNIGGEVIHYEQRDGNVFLGCERGGEGGLRAAAHRADTWVIDDRAREIAMLPYRSPRAQDITGANLATEDDENQEQEPDPQTAVDEATEPVVRRYREPVQPTYVKEIALLGRDALSALEVDRLISSFTTTPTRFVAGGFGRPVTVRAAIDPASYEGNGFNIQLRSFEGFNSGTVVRITDGVSTEYGMVARVRGRTGFGRVTLYEPTEGSYDADRTWVQPLLRDPINVNAASEEDLVRVLEGVQVGFFGRPLGNNQGLVTRDAAELVAEALIEERPVRGYQHLRDILSELADANPFSFTVVQAEAVYRNAVFANDMHLVRSSVPFRFTSSDHYEIESWAVVDDQSGRELARRGVREIVRVAPSGPLRYRLDTQADFEHWLVRAHLGPYVTTHPVPVARWGSNTALPWNRFSRMFYRFQGGFSGLGGQQERDPQGKDEDDQEAGRYQNGVFPDEEVGDVRLLPAVLGSSGYNKHFDGPAFRIREPDVALHRIDPEGWLLEDGPFEIQPRDQSGGIGGGQQAMVLGSSGSGRGGRGRRGGGGSSSDGTIGPQGNGSLQGRLSPHQVRLDMYYRLGGQAGGRRVIFDYVGADSDEDRISLIREDDGSLVARVHGRTIDNRFDRFEEVAETRWYPEDGGFWEPETWYHLGIAYRGTKPEDVLLFVDGFKRGSSRYLTRLQSGFSKEAKSFTVEDAENWPETGVAMVGHEVVAFERNGNSFDVLELNSEQWGRGQRGTRGRYEPAASSPSGGTQPTAWPGADHQAGVPVSLFGYSLLPRRARSSSRGVAIPRGGGNLKSSVGPFAVALFDSNDMITETLPGPGGGPGGPTFTLEVHDPSKANGSTLEIVDGSRGPLSYEAFPEAGGYIVIVSLLNAPGVPAQLLANLGSSQVTGGLEFLKYSRRSGAKLIGLQPVANPPNPGFGDFQKGATATFRDVIWGQRLVHPVRLSGGGLNLNLCCVFPVSIPVNNVTGYKEPETTRNNADRGDYAPWNTDPEFVQIGTPDPDNLGNHQVEWIRYHHIDPEGHLLCDELSFIQLADQYLQALLMGNVGSLDVIGSNGVLPFREQCGTGIFYVGTGARHAAGSEVVPCFRTVSFTRRESIFPANGRTTTTNNPLLDAPYSGEANCGWSPAGWGDRVTIEGPRGRSRVEAVVSWAGLDCYWSTQGQGLPIPAYDVPISGGGGLAWSRRDADLGHGWIALTASPEQAFDQRGLPDDGIVEDRTAYTRILKFPSGELPNIGRGSRALVGGDVGGASIGDGQIDEIRVTRFEPDRLVVWGHEVMEFQEQTSRAVPVAVDENEEEEIPIARVLPLIANPSSSQNNRAAYNLADGRQLQHDVSVGDLRGVPTTDAGLVRIGEEIIAFREIGPGADGGLALLKLQRGFMNTPREAHGHGANIVFLDFVPVTRLTEGLDAESALIAIADGSGLLRDGGTVLIDEEMIHYTEARNRELRMPWVLDENSDLGGGLFRGRFGTRPQSHDAEAIVLGMPFRYWDRYVPQQDSGDLAWYGVSLDLPGAYFHRLDFEKYRSGQYTDIEILCRLAGDVPWNADPDRTGGLYRFLESDPDEPNYINRAGDRLELRVFFKYLDGAFDPIDLSSHDWKRTPELRSLGLVYFDESQVLQREVLR